MTPHRAAAGFTLLELLVALVVLGFLAAGLVQGLQVGLRTWDAQARLIERHGELDAVGRALRRLIEHMLPGTYTEPPVVRGTARTLAFTTELPLAAPPGATRHADVVLLRDDAGRLLLRWTPRLHAQRFAPPPSPAETELLRGVERLELAYLRPASVLGPGGWVEAWGDPALPELVRIRVVFPAGDRRRWPDLLAAPMRERPRE